jgi:hypothetical protein
LRTCPQHSSAAISKQVTHGHPPPKLLTLDTMSSNTFADALGAWKGRIDATILTMFSYLIDIDINLTELQKSLDTQGIELVESQKESVISRKALAERTKGVRLRLFRVLAIVYTHY